MKSVQCFADFFDKIRWRIFFILVRKRVLPLSRKIQSNPPAIVFFCSVSTLIQSGSILRCLAAEKRFLLFFNGWGPLKKIKNCRNVEEVKAIDWYHSHPPLLVHFTVQQDHDMRYRYICNSLKKCLMKRVYAAKIIYISQHCLWLIFSLLSLEPTVRVRPNSSATGRE